MSLLNFKNYYLKILLILSFFVLFISTSSIVDARTSSADPIGEKLCKIVDVLSGKTAKALCIVAIFVLGITVLMGRVNWGTAAVTVCGIVLITQAAKIYDWIGKDGSNNNAQCATTASSS
ncbi:trbC/VIRB2 family protein [Orientia chuto str. Dubai]|uniref:TrbC/VIRB2 family protein n=1 Tax=Orientia chuto str. Dubai TaxID=1359168 RepID=A0A0F3MJS4_9RICK|nr:TrbC/VirB2 family protein [Candidatus Orientia mediorientalis]KJV56028.1 trbC/VIRB2 family protein [Orientia chuto str. Dubai]